MRLTILIFSFVILINGCSQDTPTSRSTVSDKDTSTQTELSASEKTPDNIPVSSVQPEPVIVATVGDTTLSLEALDQKIALKKFDLEWKLYELRLLVLDQQVAELTEQSSPDSPEVQSEIHLRPPMPPRLDIPVEERYSIGRQNAPIKLAVLCSYQSSHCMRIQPILEQLQLLYGDLVAIVPFDLPMPFHRNGRDAANAARCAASVAMLEPFQQGLYADINKLGRDRYTRIAAQLGMDVESFTRCFDNKQFDQLVQADLDFGRQLNAGNVPIVFINGLYTKGPKTIATYIYYIETELERLGIVYEESLVESESPGNDAPSEPEPVLEEGAVEERSEDAVASSPEDRLKASSTMTLSRSWLEAQLLDQQELEKSFVNAEHLVNNQYYLMRLENVGDKDFFATLGLEERDVIMKVNDQWVHSGQNAMFDEFHSHDAVSLIVMRKGLPYRYNFNITEHELE